MTTTKTCNKCEVEKPLTDFGKRKDSADGHRPTCKDCMKGNRGSTKPASEPASTRPRGKAQEPIATDSPITEETSSTVAETKPETKKETKPAAKDKVPTLTQLSKAQGKTFTVHPDDLIIAWDDNIRDLDEEHAKKFAESFSEGEFVPPVLVKKTPDGWKLTAGYHRCRGFKIAEDGGADLIGLDAIEFKGGADIEIATMFLENDGKPLTGLERAHAYLRLRGFKWDINKIAKHVKRSRSDVEKHLILAEATEPVKALVADGTISVSVAIEFVRKYGDDAHVQLTKQLAKQAGVSGKKGNAGTTPVKATPKFPAKKAQDFLNLARYLQIDDDHTNDQQVCIFAELTPEQWEVYGELIEEFKTFLEEQDNI